MCVEAALVRGGQGVGNWEWAEATPSGLHTSLVVLTCWPPLPSPALRWRKPHGRVFEMVMCELRRRMLGVPPSARRIDWDSCTLYCGGDIQQPAPPPA